jgi:hypothetical protein
MKKPRTNPRKPFLASSPSENPSQKYIYIYIIYIYYRYIYHKTQLIYVSSPPKWVTPSRNCPPTPWFTGPLGDGKST